MTAVTLTAGRYDSGTGFILDGYLAPTGTGSLSGQPLAGQTIRILATGTLYALQLSNDTTGLGPLTLTVDGANWPVDPGVYNSGQNATDYNISGGTFAPGNSYTVDLATAGGGGNTVAPATGHTFYVGYVPTVTRTANQSLAPLTGHQTYKGYVPAISQNTILAPADGHLVYAGYAPTVTISSNVVVSPGDGHLVYAGYVPGIEQPIVVPPDTGHLIYAGYAPTVAQSNNSTVDPNTGHLVYSGYVPVVFRSDNQEVAPTEGNLVYAGYIPTIVQTGANFVQPVTGHLVYQGYAPSVTQSGGGGGDQFRVGGETVQALFQTDKIAFPWDVRMKTNT